MSRTVSAAALKACLAQETNEVFLICMRVTHPNFGTIRVVNDPTACVRTDGTYQPFPFQLSLPDDDGKSIPKITVTFDNIDQTISNQLLAIQGQATAEFDIVLASQPNTVEAGPFTSVVQAAVVTYQTIVLTLSLEDDFLDQSVPSVLYLPSNSPGLF